MKGFIIKRFSKLINELNNLAKILFSRFNFKFKTLLKSKNESIERIHKGKTSSTIHNLSQASGSPNYRKTLEEANLQIENCDLDERNYSQGKHLPHVHICVLPD